MADRILLTALVLAAMGAAIVIVPAGSATADECNPLKEACCLIGDVFVACEDEGGTQPPAEPTPAPSSSDEDAEVVPVDGDEAPKRRCRQASVQDARFNLQGFVKPDGSLWAPRQIVCTPGDISYIITVCIRSCPPNTPDPPPIPTGPVASPEFLREQAFAQILPMAPPTVIQPDRPVTGVPAFLQVEGFQTRTASDSSGALTVTVTAIPREVRWTFGDRARTCRSGGAPYDQVRYEAALDANGMLDDGQTCTMLFTHASSDGGPTSGTAAILWDYSWSINGTDQGVFNPGLLSPTTEFDLTIEQIQAVITS